MAWGTQMLRYWAADHSAVARFRWDYDVLGGWWPPMLTALLIYALLMSILWAATAHRHSHNHRDRLIDRHSCHGHSDRHSHRCQETSISAPYSAIMAAYNLSMLAVSSCIFLGLLTAAQVEIEETRWLWRRRSRTPIDWMLCFPLGTRPSGRVFFWSYAFYLSKYYALLENVLLIWRRRRGSRSTQLGLGFLLLMRPCLLVITAFLSLQFSQSLQIPAILAQTALDVVVYWQLLVAAAMGRRAPRRLLGRLRMAQMVFLAVASAGLLRLHFFRRHEGCNGMISWAVTALLNASATIPLLLRPHSSSASASSASASASASASDGHANQEGIGHLEQESKVIDR